MRKPTVKKTAPTKAAPAAKVSSFGKFLGKYAEELIAVSGIVRLLLPAAPVGREDRGQIEAALSRLEMGAERVAEAASTFREVKVTPSAADVAAAVAEVLPGIVQAELARLGIKEVGERETADA